ncbi:putative chromosome segregation [Trypoxylus dichotomus]
MEVAGKEETEKYELEDHFILRLPIEQAKIIHKLLKKKPKKIKKHLSIEFTDLRHAIVKVHKKFLQAKLLDLPTIIETNKTIDGVHLCKTADMCQMLLCQEGDKASKYDTSTKKAYQYLHGLTPALKNVRKRRFRKTLKNKDDAEEAADIEKEVLLLLRTDNEAVATRFEFIYDDKVLSFSENKVVEETEITLFGDRLSDIDSEKNSSDSATSVSETNDLMDFTN